VGITTIWKQTPLASPLYNDSHNWNGGLPGSSDTAEFDASNVTNISVTDNRVVGQWLFNSGDIQYNFAISSGGSISFEDIGITINSGSVHIFDFDIVVFDHSSTAGAAVIDDYGELDFNGFSHAGSATIHAYAGGFGTGIIGSSVVYFFGNSTGDSAEFITDAGGVVDFAPSSGPDGLGHLTAGSIAGAGTYDLGGDQLKVGLNGLSTEVSGPINDGGHLYFGSGGGSLAKVGLGTLRLSHPGNTYSGGTTLVAGKLDVAALGAAGTGAITFHGRATLKLEHAAMPSHHFGNTIAGLSSHDIIDIAELRFQPSATATYNPGNHHLTVHSSNHTDTLTLLSPHGFHFGTANDGHGGVDVFLLLHA
jgi:autotransporter-associated beta strand protein